MIDNNKISFDFDGTLSNYHSGDENIYKETVQENLKLLISLGYEVYIITRRFDHYGAHKGLTNEHLPVLKMAEMLGVNKNNIYFTNRDWKYEIIRTLGIHMHLDDDEVEKFWIDRHCPDVKTVLVGSEDWQGNFLKNIETELKKRKASEMFLEKIKIFLKKCTTFFKK